MKSFSLSIVGLVLLSLVPGCGADGGGRADDSDSIDFAGSVTPQNGPGIFVPQGENPPGGPPAIQLTEIGGPTWRPSALTQFSESVFNFGAVQNKILPAPEHQFHPQLGKGPGVPHPPPYDVEMASNIAALNLNFGSIFEKSEGTFPFAIFNVFMVVPTDDAPLGSSPDFASGPIISHALFPISMTAAMYNKGAAKPSFKVSGKIPALNAITPGWDVDGHSHFPMFFAHTLPKKHYMGEHTLEITMTDTTGSGWVIATKYVVQPDHEAAAASDALSSLAPASVGDGAPEVVSNIALSPEP